MKEIETPEYKKLYEEFLNKYMHQIKAFNKKYQDNLNTLYKGNDGKIVTSAMIEEHLEKQNIKLSSEEKALLAAQQEFMEIPQNQKIKEIQLRFGKSIKEWDRNHSEFRNGLFYRANANARQEKIPKILGIQLGFASDIMNSQDYCHSIVAEMTPSTDEKLLAIQKDITTPFIASYIALKNNESKAKLEANKKLSIANVNEVPKTEGDKVFDAIMEKYKGKVVYVDFWATWCGPCRSTMAQQKSMKEALKDKDIVFVYLTNQTSPEQAYNNMIPDIGGEHYRLSDDQWRVLSSRFNVRGIPHYLVVNKAGEVVDYNAPRDPQVLMPVFEKLMAE
jgi:thiol-disulfide isomerase/thioredoxin